MYNKRYNVPEDSAKFHAPAPSFSSTLLDQIYRSIDDGEGESAETNFYRHTKKHTIRTTQPATAAKSQQHRRFIHHDASVSSNAESLSRRVAPGASFRSERHATRVFNGLCRYSEEDPRHATARDDDDDALIKSKSRALKIYNNLKKVKQPISPGGRVTSFLNSLFANARKTTSNNRTCLEEVKSVRAPSSSSSTSSSSSSSTCSSATSFSRSCLSKSSCSERERVRNGAKRTVRFYPVSVIVGEDSRACGHKRLCEEKIGKSYSMRKGDEEASREFLKEYCNGLRKKNNGFDLKDLRRTVDYEDEDDDDDDDDASSYASSDLFELDHLAVFGNSRFCEELPVYETTRVSTNRAIAKGLVL